MTRPGEQQSVDLRQAIADRLTTALSTVRGSNAEAPTAEAGLAYGGPDQPVIALTVEDVARIAAQAAEEWHGTAAVDGWAAGYSEGTAQP